MKRKSRSPCTSSSSSDTSTSKAVVGSSCSLTLILFGQTLCGKYPYSSKARAYATTRSQFSPRPVTDQRPDTRDTSFTLVSVCSCNHLILQPPLPIHSPTFSFCSLNVSIADFSCLSFNACCCIKCSFTMREKLSVRLASQASTLIVLLSGVNETSRYLVPSRPRPLVSFHLG